MGLFVSSEFYTYCFVVVFKLLTVLLIFVNNSLYISMAFFVFGNCLNSVGAILNQN